ncbi:MAG: hypothetical protein AAGK37_19180 [Pseudomonadota bacterium]
MSWWTQPDPAAQAAARTYAPLPYTGVSGANQDVVDRIAQAWGYVLPGGRIVGTSGARPGGRSSSQHYTGNAWDYGVYRADGSQVRWDDPEVLMAAEIAATMDMQGFGWGGTYMGGNYFHFDDGRNPHAPRGGIQVWSDDDGGPADRGPGAAQYLARLQAAADMGLEAVLASYNVHPGETPVFPRPSGSPPLTFGGAPSVPASGGLGSLLSPGSPGGPDSVLPWSPAGFAAPSMFAPNPRAQQAQSRGPIPSPELQTPVVPNQTAGNTAFVNLLDEVRTSLDTPRRRIWG